MEYALVLYTVAKYLTPPMKEEIVLNIARHYGENISQTIVLHNINTIDTLINYLERIQRASRTNSGPNQRNNTNRDTQNFGGYNQNTNRNYGRQNYQNNNFQSNSYQRQVHWANNNANQGQRTAPQQNYNRNYSGNYRRQNYER